MIHVERGPDPAVDAQWRVEEARANGRKVGFRAKGIRFYEAALRQLFHSKCAYCETLIEVPSAGAVDRFKPQSLYPDLAMEWCNLYLSCQVCNAYKRDIDPVDRGSERVWMLDPCADDPRAFLIFHANGTVSPRSTLNPETDKQRAARTISALGLNRDNLVLQRRTFRAVTEPLLRHLMKSYPNDWRNREEIRDLITPEAPFFAATLDTIERIMSEAALGAMDDLASEQGDPATTEALAGLATGHDCPGKHTISLVSVRNIGPFEHLRLMLRPGWNLLLGDNGCGKSTLLRALALALAGSDKKAALAADRLLRAGAETGSISLWTDHHVYESSLVKVRGSVDTTPHAETLVADGQWLTLAFPAMRGHSARAIAGPTLTSPPNPGVHDLLPILDNIADPRFDDTRQWIVNTALRAEGDESEESRDRHRRLLDWWFEVIRALIPGPHFEFDHLDRDTWQVFVRTEDGIIPIEQLSLGMVATIGWIGTLLRRLSEAYPESEKPELEPALVLIDEIDAHLHPSWQQQLVPLVRERFPNLQVIAATHSALIANNLGPDEIIVLSRDDTGRVNATRIEESLQGMRADQVYTSPAFGLSATRGKAIEQLLREYRSARETADGSAESNARIAELSARVHGEISSYPETAEARRELDEKVKAADESIRKRLRQASPDELRELEALLEGQPAKREVS